VAFWALTPKQADAEQRYVVSLHGSLKEIEDWYLQAVTRLHLQLPDRRMVAAYVDQHRMRVKGVKIDFEVEEDKP